MLLSGLMDFIGTRWGLTLAKITGISVTLENEEPKKDGRSLPHNVLEAHRFAALQLHKQGVKVDVIAKSFGVTLGAVYRWLRTARTEGKSGLKSTSALGPEPRLTREQFKELISVLRRPARKEGFSTDLWSGPRVRALIKNRFGVDYHPKHMPRFLRRLGLTQKFPERRALEQDPQKLRQWKEKRLPEILEYAKKRRALVFYADESLVALIPYVGKSWSFPEAKPVVRVSGKRGQHVGITAAVNAQGRMTFELTKEKERFTARTFLRFIRKLRRENPSRRVVLIVDGAPIHKAKIVKSFQKEQKSWLRMEILPAYSPECNPTEKAWGFVKTKKMNACTAQDKVELRQQATKAMRELKKDGKQVASFFSHLE